MVLPALKAIYYPVFRLLLRSRFWFADRFSRHQSETPVPPAFLRYRVSESLAVGEFLRVGEGCAIRIGQYLNQMGVNVENADRVLDFGCGCGRTIGWFLRANGTTEFHGVDVDREAIEWCKRHLPKGHFLASASTPPLPYPDRYFDGIYCMSVFTHLNEAMQDAWLAELRRVLQPGGALLLTVYGATASSGLDSDGKRMLQESGFVHRRSQKLKGLVPDWYQTSWHSREYIVERLAREFEDIRYYVIPDGLQDFVVGRTKEYKED